MRKLFVLLISLVFFTTSGLAQSKRKLKKEAKELQKNIDNLDLEIFIRNIDLTKVFIVQNKIERRNNFAIHDPKSEEESWNQALFINGLDVGIYSIDKKVKNEVVIKGDYLIEVYVDMVKFIDLYDQKLVATIMYNLNTIKYKNQVIAYIIQEFVKEANAK